jgi:hypothetical protein
MDLATIIVALRNSVGRYAKEYAEGRARQDALAPYAKASAALAALAPSSSLGIDERSRLVLALVAEQQHKPHALWQAMLTVAFEPMLRRLRRRLSQLADEDLDQEVLVEFFAAVHALPPAERVVFPLLATRRTTERGVFTAVKTTRQVPVAERFDEETFPGNPFFVETMDALLDAAAEEAARVHHTGGGGEELRDVVLATFSREASLKAYVERTYAVASEAQRSAAYERLRSARRRLRARLRSSLAGTPPSP